MKPQNRRRPTDHDVVMRVIGIMGLIAFALYGALAICLVLAVFNGLRTGKWDIAIITTLITAVASGGGSASGFVGGVLSQTFGGKGSPVPITVENPPADPANTKDVEDGDVDATPTA